MPKRQLSSRMDHSAVAFAAGFFFSADKSAKSMTPEDISPNGNGATSAAEPLTEERVRAELRNVVDPEIGIDMVSLGLIYDVKIEGTTVFVTMTLTSPGCPVAGMFINAVHAALMSIPGVSEAKVDLTFTPPWDPRTMASEDAKMMMGIYY
jgi:metal-sulfur cluster biosynthetic enzyme